MLLSFWCTDSLLMNDRCLHVVLNFFTDAIVLFPSLTWINYIELMVYHMALLKASTVSFSWESASAAHFWSCNMRTYTRRIQIFVWIIHCFLSFSLTFLSSRSKSNRKILQKLSLKCLKSFCGCRISSVFSLALPYRGFSHYYVWMSVWLLCLRVYWSLSLMTEP